MERHYNEPLINRRKDASVTGKNHYYYYEESDILDAMTFYYSYKITGGVGKTGKDYLKKERPDLYNQYIAETGGVDVPIDYNEWLLDIALSDVMRG